MIGKEIRTHFAALALLLLAACTVNPATGQKEFTPFMTPGQEAAIGAQENPKLVAEFGGEYQDSAVATYVEGIGDQLARSSEMPGTDFEFTVLNSSIINAFALPGGYVNVSRGLMAYFNDEAEMASVLGHEIGHVTARHAANRYNKTVFTALGVGIFGAVTGREELTNILGTGAQLALLSYSRSQESQADGLGLRYMVNVAYDPDGSVRMLESLEAATGLDAKRLGQSPDAAPSWARTHPLTSQRIEDQKARVAALMPQPATRNTNRNRFLDAIDGMLFGDDPEQGVIRGQEFLHPVLRLAFTAPAGFTLQNTARYVIGSADNAQFAFAGGAVASTLTTRAYLDQVWNGLFENGAPTPLANIRTLSTGGMDGVSGEARVTNDSGALDVEVVAWRYDSTHAYHFILITAPSATAGYANAFRSLVMSFRKMPAAEAAAIKPLRIKVVTVQSGDTVSALAARMAVDDYREELFRALNGLGPNDGLQAGQRVKIVVEG